MRKISLVQPVSDNKGYIVILVLITVAAFAVATASVLLLFSVSSSQSSLFLEQSNQAKALANACAEAALNRVRTANNFSGTVNLNLGNGTCAYTVVRLSKTVLQILAVGNVNFMTRKVRISLTVSKTKITVQSWMEVGE